LASSTRISAVLKPWYRQFYVRRGDAPWASDEVSSEGYDRGVEAIGGFMYVGTTMYGSPTTVTVEVTETEPPTPSDADKCATVEVGGAGPLALLSWGDDEPVAIIDVPRGSLRCRVSWTGSEEASAHPDAEIGGQSPSPEALRIQVWPAP